MGEQSQFTREVSQPHEGTGECRTSVRAWQRMKIAWETALDLVFPPLCLCCSREFEALTVAAKLCDDCDEALQASTSAKCPRCGQFWMNQENADRNCASCRRMAAQFDRVYAHGKYEGALREVIIRMKCDQHEILTREMGRLFARSLVRDWEGPEPDIVTAVPVHWWRRISRRTHVSALLARTVGQQLGVPTTIDLLACTRRMGKQAWLLPQARARNVRGGFRVISKGDVEGKHVLVVDDVMTTGATLDEIAKMLKRKDAQRVTVAVVARGVGDTIGS